MADNTRLPVGTQDGDIYASDDIAGVKIQRVKLVLGADGSNDGDASSTNPIPVSDNAGSITVDGTISTTEIAATIPSSTTMQNAATGNGNGTSLNVQGYSTALLTLAISGAATINFETSADDATWIAIYGCPVGSSTPTTTFNGNGGFRINVNGYKSIRARISSYTGGTVTVIGYVIAASSPPNSVIAVDGGGTISIDDGSSSITVDNGGTFTVQDSEKIADNGGFTDGTTKVLPAGYILDETAGTALTENDAAAARIDSKRAQVLVIEDATTRGRRATVDASGRVSVDASGVAVPITDNSGSLTVDNAGTFAVQAASAEADGANVTLGAKADAKSTATDSTPITAMSVLKQISASVQSPPSQAVTGPLTDTQLRASEVPVSVAAIPSHAVTNAGTFAVQATIAAGATTIAKAEDAAAADGDVGVPVLAVRKISPCNLSTAECDYEFLQMSQGRLFTSSKIDNAMQMSEQNFLNNIVTQYAAMIHNERSSSGAYGFELR